MYVHKKLDACHPPPAMTNLFSFACLLGSYIHKLIAWLSKMRRQHGKIFRIFTGSRPYIVLMDKVVRTSLCPPAPPSPNLANLLS